MLIRDRISTAGRVHADFAKDGERSVAFSVAGDHLSRGVKRLIDLAWFQTADDLIATAGEGPVAVDTPGRTTELLAVSYTPLRAHETVLDLVCRLLLEKNN